MKFSNEDIWTYLNLSCENNYNTELNVLSVDLLTSPCGGPLDRCVSWNRDSKSERIRILEEEK